MARNSEPVSAPSWEEAGVPEPFRTIRRAPFRFLSGVVIIASGVVLLTVFLADRHFGLFIGASAGFQGAGYMILMRHLRKARVGQ